VSQIRSKTAPNNELRRVILVSLIVAMIASSFAYGYGAFNSYREAVPSTRERTFEILVRKSRSQYFVHQRADGGTVEGISYGPPLAYGSACALVERLNGDFGFSWVRVLDRSPPPEHEVIWPIRREDCFSDKPLATLRR